MIWNKRRFAFCTFALALVAVALPARGATNPCTVDPQTGFPVPDTIPGLCVVESEASLRLVQVTADGLLIVIPETDATTGFLENADGTRSLRIHDRTTLVVYCPESQLDAASGAPLATCLSDFSSLATGSAAYLGFGTVQASAITLDAGAVSCPASMHVLGGLRNAEGDHFDLHSSLVFSARTDGMTRTGRDRGPATACDVAFSEANLEKTRRPFLAAPARLEDHAELLAQLDLEESLMLEDLLELNDEQFSMLEELLFGGSGGEGSVGVGGPCISPFSNECLKDKIKEVKEKVDGIKGETGALAFELTEKFPALRALAERVKASQLVALFDQIDGEIQGFIATLQLLRQDFENFGADDCEVDSPTACGEFKTRLNNMISDMEDVVDFVKSISCLDSPNKESRGLRPMQGQPDLLRNLIDKAPPLALFGMSRVLERVAPEGAAGVESSIGDWSTMFQDVLAKIPQELITEIQNACEQDPEIALGGDPLRCKILRPPLVGQVIEKAHPVGKALAFLTKIEDALYTPDDFELTIEGVVGGGAGVGAQVLNVLKAIIKIQRFLGDKLGSDKAKSIFDNLKAKRKDCLDTDKDIEGDVRGCSPRLSYFLSARLPGVINIPFHRPSYNQVVDQVHRNILQVGVCKVAGGCTEANIAAAQGNLAQAELNPHSRKGFEFLCDAYCELTGGDSCNQAGGGPADPEQCMNGVDDNDNGLIDCADPFCVEKPFCN